ncbi:UNVERIFIED_CONTAM: autophagy- protein 2 [Siphonaria sp. JEL0065]|nr:autophagy- protein 2 [Siphonaria sp. JEL0065]
MAPHLISLAETIYYDGNEGYSDEEDLEQDEEEQEFGYKSWFHIGEESMENVRAKLTNRGVKESAILKARNGALSNSKMALIIHMKRIQLSLGKLEFDLLQLLINDLQLYQGMQAPAAESLDEESEDGFSSGLDLNHLPFQLSLIVRVGEIGIRVFEARGDNGVLDWAYNSQMNENHVVVSIRDGGDLDAHVEMDRIALTNLDGQAIFLRSENTKEAFIVFLFSLRAYTIAQKRPMLAIAFKSIYDKFIGMKENAVSVAVSDLRVLVVDHILTNLGKEVTSFLVEPPGLVPIEIIDAVTKISLILNGVVIDYRPMYRSFRALLLVRKIKIALNLIPHSPTFGISVSVGDVSLHLLKSSGFISFDIDEQSLMIEKGVATYLKQCRYASVLSCDLLDLSFRQTRALEDDSVRVEVEVSNGHAYLDICLDSYRLLLDIVEYIAAGGDSQYFGNTQGKESQPETKLDLTNVPDMDHILESIDDAAFTKFIPSAEKVEREYSESELNPADVEGAIEIMDPQYAMQKAEIIVHEPGPFEFYEDYFSLTGTPGVVEEDVIVPDKVPPLVHIRVKDVNIILRLFDGFDFPIQDFPDDESDGLSNHPLEDSMLNDFENQPKSSPSAAMPTLEARSLEPRIQTNLNRINVELKSYPETSVCASELHFSIDAFEVIDNVTTSMWRKFLTVMRPGADDVLMETGSSMLVIEWVKVRPNLEVPETQEIRLKVYVSPLRFYVDQDALSFIGHFLSYGPPPPPPTTETASQATADDEIKGDLFFQMCSIRPIPVKIDYKPKHVNLESLRGGNLLEVFNFVPLEGAEMTLNQVRLNGVQGMEKLIQLIRNQWLQEVTKNQSHRVVKGLSGIKPIANIGAGIADLILLPWQQYQREGRVIRGLEKGAKSFSKTAAMEALALGTRLAITTQAILEGVEKNTSGRSQAGGSYSDKNKSKLSEQPRNIREGVEQGAQSLARNVNNAVKTVMDAPGKGIQSEGSSASAVARAVPVAILRPMIGATEAVSKTLLGLQNTIDPTKKKQMEDKYKD